MSWAIELHFCAVAKVRHTINSTHTDEVLRLWLMFVGHKQTTQEPYMMEEQQVYWNKRKSHPHSTVAQAKLMAHLCLLWSRPLRPSFTQARVSSSTEDDNRNFYKLSHMFTKQSFFLSSHHLHYAFIHQSHVFFLWH